MEKGHRLFRIVQRIVQFFALQFVVFQQFVIRFFWEKQRRDEQCVDNFFTGFAGTGQCRCNVFKIMPDDIVSANIVRAFYETGDIGVRAAVKLCSVGPDAAGIQYFFCPWIDLCVYECNNGHIIHFSKNSLTISRMALPYFSAPALPKYGMRSRAPVSVGRRFDMPRSAFCCRMT